MGHIRPKVKKGGARYAGSAASKHHQQGADDKAIEETRIRLGQWMGVGERPHVESASEKLSGIPRQVVSVSQEDDRASNNSCTGGSNDTRPKSILRKSKYSQQTCSLQGHDSSQQSTSTAMNQSVFKQENILERDITLLRSDANHGLDSAARQLSSSSTAAAVEGYEPRFDHNKRLNSIKKEKDKAETNESMDEDEEPLIFNALSDMMNAAGTLPPQDSDETPQMVEASISFSCLSPEDYQRQLSQLEANEEDDNSNNDGKPSWKTQTMVANTDTIEDGYTGSNPVSDEEEGEFDDDESDVGNGFFDLMGDEGTDDESEARDLQPRAFRVIWECLSPLITHESVDFLRKLRIEHETTGNHGYVMTATPTDDLAYSRSNGFMAMLRMYISKSLEELGQSADMRRTAEQRLLGLVYTFNFSRPAGKLETAQWRALTCILLGIIFFLDSDYGVEEGRSELPATVKATGMTVEEYKYLAKNTIRVFDIPDPVMGHAD